MTLNRNLGISAKLSLLSLTFVLPVAYLVWLLIAQQQIAIGFAAKEVDGAQALGMLVAAQSEADQDALAHRPATALAAVLGARRADIPPELDTAQAFNETVAAF